MKKLNVLLLTLLCCASCSRTPQATFTGSIGNYDPDDVLFIYVQGLEQSGYDTLDIDDKGNFTYTVALEELSEGIVFAGSKQDENGSDRSNSFCVLLQPGKTVHADIALRPLSVKFSGDEAAKSTYANQFYHAFSLSSSFIGDTLAAVHPTFAAAEAFVDGEIAKMKATVETITDKTFTEEALSALADRRESALFDYAIGSEKIGRAMSSDADFGKFVADIDPNDTLQIGRIYNYIEWYYTAHPGLYLPLSAGGAKIKYLTEYTQNQDVRNQMANLYLVNVLFLASFGLDTSNSEFKDLYEQYLAVSTDTTYTKFVKESLAGMAAQEPGKEPIDFTLEYADGTPVQFAALMGSGHVTYVDFWATWCGPCKAEIPHLDKMAVYYKEKGLLYSAQNPKGKVRIISVSIDADRQAWLDKIAKDAPIWEQCIVPDIENCAGLTGYNIQSIPRFMLFDADGKLYRSSAPRPSEVETRALIDSMIQ